MASGSCRLGLLGACATFFVFLITSFFCNDIAGNDYWLNLQSFVQSASPHALPSLNEQSRFAPTATAQNVPKPSASLSASVSNIPRKLQEWYPVNVFNELDGPAVKLISLGHPRPSQLLKKIKRTMESQGNRKTMSVEDFISAVDHDKFGVPARTIFVGFKVGRCGSTLLDTMLARDPRFLLVAEPGVMNDVRRIIHGDDERARDLRRRTFSALLRMMAVPLTSEQEVAMLDMNSQSTHSVSDIVAGANLAMAHSFFLWRNPIEAAHSFLLHPPGWLRHRYSAHDTSDNAHVAAIKGHLEDMSGAVQHLLAAGGQQLQVFWYQQILNGLVPEWILNKSFSHADPKAKINLMEALLIDAKTGKPRDQGKIDHDELTLTGALKERGQVWYNSKLVNFRNKHSPTDFEASKMQPIKELRWPQDETEILRHVVGDLRQVPVVVRNALASTSFAEKKPGEVLAQVPALLERAPLLKAIRENQFVWHPPEKQPPKGYTVYSEWHRSLDKDAAMNLFNGNPQYQIVAGGNYILSRLFNGSTRQGPLGAVVKMQEQATGKLRRKAAKASIRVSHVGAVTALHYDSGPSQLLQAEGAKEVLLWNSSYLPNLYPYGRNHFMWRRCLADPEQPDHQLLPRFQVSDGFRVMIRQGDLLYWPDRWAHYIRTIEGPSVSIGYRDQLHAVISNESVPGDLIEKVERTRYAKGNGPGFYEHTGHKRSLFEHPDFHMDDDDAELFL